ncbi:hypothetical protein HK101_005241 [Irineochytrium annulatum]|nr:hypothetical protein HK101_005241 [Irineochytrium annulatum]
MQAFADVTRVDSGPDSGSGGGGGTVNAVDTSVKDPTAEDASAILDRYEALKQNERDEQWRRDAGWRIRAECARRALGPRFSLAGSGMGEDDEDDDGGQGQLNADASMRDASQSWMSQSQLWSQSHSVTLSQHTHRHRVGQLISEERLTRPLRRPAPTTMAHHHAFTDLARSHLRQLTTHIADPPTRRGGRPSRHPGPVHGTIEPILECALEHLRLGLHEEAYAVIERAADTVAYGREEVVQGYAGMVAFACWRVETHVLRVDWYGASGGEVGEGEGNVESRHYERAVDHFGRVPLIKDLFVLYAYQLARAAEDDERAREVLEHHADTCPQDPNAQLRIALELLRTRRLRSSTSQTFSQSEIYSSFASFTTTVSQSATASGPDEWVAPASKYLELDPRSDPRLILLPLVDQILASVAETDDEFKDEDGDGIAERAMVAIVRLLAARLDYAGGERDEGEVMAMRGCWERLIDALQTLGEHYELVDVWEERAGWWPELHLPWGLVCASMSEGDEALLVIKSIALLKIFPDASRPHVSHAFRHLRSPAAPANVSGESPAADALNLGSATLRPTSTRILTLHNSTPADLTELLDASMDATDVEPILESRAEQPTAPREMAAGSAEQRPLKKRRRLRKKAARCSAAFSADDVNPSEATRVMVEAGDDDVRELKLMRRWGGF